MTADVDVLARIAVALERIAATLEAANGKPDTTQPQAAEPISEGDRRAVARLRAVFGRQIPGHRQIQAVLECGTSKADRLRNIMRSTPL